MRAEVMAWVAQAAGALGLEPDRVMTKSAADNLTLPRPRIEVQFLPESYQKTGRRLGWTNRPAREVKKELYQINLPAAVQILASDPDWLKDFAPRLAAALTGGFNDASGNYVKVMAQQGQWEGFLAKRVGAKVIDPIVKRGYLLHLTVTWRITVTEPWPLVENLTINPKVDRIGG